MKSDSWVKVILVVSILAFVLSVGYGITTIPKLSLVEAKPIEWTDCGFGVIDNINDKEILFEYEVNGKTLRDTVKLTTTNVKDNYTLVVDQNGNLDNFGGVIVTGFTVLFSVVLSIMCIDIIKSQRREETPA